MKGALTEQGAPLFWPHQERYEVVLIKRGGDEVGTRALVPIVSAAAFVLLWFTAVPPTVVNRPVSGADLPPGARGAGPQVSRRSRAPTQRARRPRMCGMPSWRCAER
ncbi:hypothetical protein [Kitasatospora sp. NPDC056181]|uniref:hypothetical protein n=1 Tax=Kitasatospora sp. NPDC056181 TaxID=3345737 RepID=UPI0035D561F5